MKPLIFYVDDEPHNLTVFEAAMSPEWEVRTFDNPLAAIESLTTSNPCVIVSDQRMPGMMGVAFLEVSKRTNPFAKRILVTGFSDEDLVVESVRKAQVHDYIRKPWDVDDLCNRVQIMIDAYQLEEILRNKTQELESQNQELKRISAELTAAKDKEAGLRRELESWAPPFVLKAIYEDKIQFPITRDLAVVTFDIVNSSRLHDKLVQSRPLRAVIQQAFTESVIRHGGWRESSAGDSAYAHFGLLNTNQKPVESAWAVASELRMFLRNLALKESIEVECGLGLHIATNCTINVSNVTIQTPTGQFTQKSFDTYSPDVDLVHRIEKMTHQLPGSNIAVTEEFLKALPNPIPGLIELGWMEFKGQAQPRKIFLKPSDRATKEEIEALQKSATATPANKSAA